MDDEEIPSGRILRGLQVKEADKSILQDLKAAGKVFKHETYLHSYPFCYRSDTPLIYKSIKARYVAVEKIKDRLKPITKPSTGFPGTEEADGSEVVGQCERLEHFPKRFGEIHCPFGEMKKREAICVGSREASSQW